MSIVETLHEGIFLTSLITISINSGTFSNIRAERRSCIFHPLLAHTSSRDFPAIPPTGRKEKKEERTKHNTDEINKSTCNFVVVDASVPPSDV